MAAVLMTSCNYGVIDLDVQGHRGCRGLMPENTLPAFEKAWELGVTTLEMDVVVTADSQVVVSHEAWMSHEISTKPDGAAVTAAEEHSLNIYQMTYAQVMTYDCGKRVHPRFPDQQKLPVFKPLLNAVIEHMEEYYTSTDYEQDEYRRPKYNIEIKTEPGGMFNPEPKRFVELVLAELTALQANERPDLMERVTLQSFDLEVLREIRRQHKSVQTALLVEEDEEYSSKLRDLGFYPEILSPDFHHVDEDMLKFAATKNMKVVPWTVNEEADMRRLVQLGVHGIITDYPDRLLALLEEL